MIALSEWAATLIWIVIIVGIIAVGFLVSWLNSSSRTDSNDNDDDEVDECRCSVPGGACTWK